MAMLEASSENFSLICRSFHTESLQEFEVDYTKKYMQLILNFFWVVYMIYSQYSYLYFTFGSFHPL